MTFTVVLVVVELRCLRAKFTSFFIIPPPPPPLTMPAQWLDSLTVVAKLCRLIKLLYSLERKLSACLIWSSPDGERERGGGGCINKRFPGQQASFVCVCSWKMFNEMNFKGKIYYLPKMK